MYHQTDYHLHREVAWDLSVPQPCSYEVICQDCDEKEKRMTKHDFHQKWSKIFDSKTEGGKQMILSSLEQQELLNNSQRIKDISATILPRGEDDYEYLIQTKYNYEKDEKDKHDNTSPKID